MKALFVVVALLLTGCDAVESSQPDQCLRAELFKSCMAILPAGPTATRYNDWDEVVSECGSQSFYQSLRRSSTIKPECRP